MSKTWMYRLLPAAFRLAPFISSFAFSFAPLRVPLAPWSILGAYPKNDFGSFEKARIGAGRVATSKGRK